MTVRIIVGDAMEELRKLPAESVHCCVTSPPYWGLRDYGVGGQIGLEETVEGWVARLVEVFREVRRILRKDGTCWLNLGDSYANSQCGGGSVFDKGRNDGRISHVSDQPRGREATTYARKPGLASKQLLCQPWRLALALQSDGWWLRSDIIWHKPNPMPESVTDRPTKAHEYLFLLSKAAEYYFDADAVRVPCVSLDEKHPSFRPNSAEISRAGRKEYSAKHEMTARTYPLAGRNIRTVWKIATHPFAGAHFATFPPKLVEPCIKAGTSERGRCSECGAPWTRVVEKSFRAQEDVSTERGIRGHEGQKPMDATSGWAGFPRGHADTVTVGWRESCGHASPPVPCTVLDPFIGSGTTALVADRLGRDCIGIELNPEYARIARNRLEQDAPLFMEVGLDDQ